MNSGDCNSGDKNRFTFQYGSTQIIYFVGNDVANAYLHSNMVLLKC